MIVPSRVLFCGFLRLYPNLTPVVIFVVFAFFLSFSGYPQATSRIDSLKEKLNANPVNRFEVLWSLAYDLFDVDNAQAVVYAKEAYLFSKVKLDTANMVKSGRLYGQLLRRNNRLDESIDLLRSILPISKDKRYEKETKHILNALAAAYTFKTEYDKALEYNYESLIIREKEGDERQISIALNNIGLVHYKLSNTDSALQYYFKSLQAKELVKDSFDLDRLYINIGLCYSDIKDYNNSFAYFNKAFAVCATDCSDQIIVEGEMGIGQSLLGQGKFNEANTHLKKSLEISMKIGYKQFQLNNLCLLARTALSLNNLIETRNYLDQLDAIEETNQFKDILLAIYGLKADYYTNLKDFEKASFFNKKNSQLKDSLFTTQLIKNLTRIQTKIAQRENLATIAEKNEILALNQEVIAQQRILNWLLAAVAVMALTLGTVIYRNYKRIKAVNAELSEAKQTIEIQNELLDAQNKILDEQVRAKTKELVQTNDALRKVNDELDNFIYKTSHDIRGPLTTLRGMTNLALMDVSDEKALGYLTKLDLTADRLNKILTRLQIVNRINHAELKLELIHFEPIIQEILTLEMKKGVPKKVKMEYEVGADVRLMSDKEMVRIVLENLIDNAFKFYNESQRVESFVKIFVKVEDGHVVTRVLDNGIGIGPMDKEKIFNMFVRASERSQTGGIGLYLSKLATEKLGGDITLTSTTEKYTEFIVRFPVDLQAVIDKRKADQQEGSQKGASGKENPVIHNA